MGVWDNSARFADQLFTELNCMTRYYLLSLTLLAMTTGCGTTLVVGPMIGTGDHGNGVIVSVEQPLWALGSDDGRIGLVTKASGYGGWSSTQGSYAGGGAGVDYVIIFKDAPDRRRMEPVEELPYNKQPLEMVKAQKKENATVYLGLSGGYIYSSEFGGDFMLVAPEFGMSLNVGSWRDRYVDVGARLQCLLSAQSQACGPALTMTLRPKLF